MFVVGQSEKMLLTLLVSLCIVFSLLISSLVFQDSVLSSDEWSYLIQAQIFSHGKLAVPSPRHREFFDFIHIVNNGRYYSKYPPGWPFLLAIGVWLGMPRVVNSLLGAGTLLLLYAIGKKLYTLRIALLASLFAVASPYFLFNTASYFSHTASLFFVTLLLFLLMCGWEKRRWSYFLLAGLSGSASFLVRPFDQCAVLVPIGIFLIVSRMRKQLATHHIASFALGQLSGVLLFLLYNALQNGHPLVTGYHVADSWMDRWIGPESWMWAYDVHYFVKLLTWSFPGIPLLALVALVSTGPERMRRWERCLASVLFSIMIAYAMIAFPEGPGYGPRYYYSGFLALPLLGARGFAVLLKKSTERLRVPLLIGAVLLEVGVVMPHHGAWAYKVIHEQDDFERQVKRINPGPALVFLAVEPDANQDRTRNTIDFHGSVVYAIDQGERNSVLMQAYPGRRYFRYEYDHASGRAMLREIARRDH
jgi:4-amino-4-deoxy-L-arabinose transferase-like glycosyltransferase